MGPRHRHHCNADRRACFEKQFDGVAPRLPCDVGPSPQQRGCLDECNDMVSSYRDPDEIDWTTLPDRPAK